MAILVPFSSVLPVFGRHLTRLGYISGSWGSCRRFSRTGHSAKTVRIGCASGFWGDTTTAVPQLVHQGNLDFLVFDYLSEVTMSLLVAARLKVPDMGYTPDFLQVAMGPHLKAIKQKGIRVISNAGGINPHGCAAALKEMANKCGVDLKIAVVTGDDLMPQEDVISKMGITDMVSGQPFPTNVHSMNVYLGAGPIVKALDMGADVVITGRCVDSAVTLAPMMHTFRWAEDDLDKLAAGSLAGHLIECGVQATGGMFTDWRDVPNWENMGFPIVQCEESGKFTITKPPKTGGIVTTATVAEQLVYEIGDPERYLLPDITCDFSQVKLTQLEENIVLVEGARGKIPPPTYKVSATFADGYRATAVCPIIGRHAFEKAKRTGESILNRTQNIYKQLQLEDFRRVHVEVLGSEHNYGSDQSSRQATREAVVWLAVHHNDRKALDIFSREIAHAALGGAPGLTTMVGGRPKAIPVLRLFSFLYPKEKIKVEVQLDNGPVTEYSPSKLSSKPNTESIANEEQSSATAANLLTGSQCYRLEQLAYARSGDKADTANIGVIARHPSFYPYLQKHITADAVANYFKHLFPDGAMPSAKVKRYMLPGINGMNFVLSDALGGGGVASLRSDPLGKGLGQILLDFTITNMPTVEDILQHSTK